MSWQEEGNRKKQKLGRTHLFLYWRAILIFSKKWIARLNFRTAAQGYVKHT